MGGASWWRRRSVAVSESSVGWSPRCGHCHLNFGEQRKWGTENWKSGDYFWPRVSLSGFLRSARCFFWILCYSFTQPLMDRSTTKFIWNGREIPSHLTFIFIGLCLHFEQLEEEKNWITFWFFCELEWKMYTLHSRNKQLKNYFCKPFQSFGIVYASML